METRLRSFGFGGLDAEFRWNFGQISATGRPTRNLINCNRSLMRISRRTNTIIKSNSNAAFFSLLLLLKNWRKLINANQEQMSFLTFSNKRWKRNAMSGFVIETFLMKFLFFHFCYSSFQSPPSTLVLSNHYRCSLDGVSAR